MDKKAYYKQYQLQHEAMKKLVEQDLYRCKFHLMPPTGWLNDPNGLFQLHGVNHIYYQYSPFTAEWGMKLWGHYTTKNWIDYTMEEPFLFPDALEDKDGVYSGCATVVDNNVHFFYTGNVKYQDKLYDYIYAGREQNVIEVISKDGFYYDEKICRLKNSDYPQNMSVHVRDPKVFAYENKWYMVLGARTKQDVGCALLYQSDDLKTWKFHMEISPQQTFGFMWECCDLILVDNQWFLLCCPQGVKQQGDNYANVYQYGYFPLTIDFDTKVYELETFYELDRGFDIYAPQTYIDEQGRRILLAWMGIPDATYHNPTIHNQWQHALTLPKLLTCENKRIIQQPLSELQQLRQSEYSGKAKQIAYDFTVFEYEAHFHNLTKLNIQIGEDVYFIYEHNTCCLSLGASGYGRTMRRVHIEQLSTIHIFVDKSAIEIFINDGIEVFTTRFYPKQMQFSVCANEEFDYKIWELKGYTLIDNHPSIQMLKNII